MIFVNARFLTQNVTGVQRFAIELSRELVLKLGTEVKFIAPYNIIQKDLAEEFHVEIIGKCTGYLWEQIELPLYLKRKGSPKLINLCSMAPALYSNNIVTIHDRTWVRFPDTFSRSFKIVYRFLTPLLCREARKILTVSRFSLKEISDYFQVERNKFSVIYNAVDKRFLHKVDENLGKDPYFLAVSSIKGNKNFKVVLESFLLLQNKS